MTPYVYRIKSKQGHFYYGCRYSKDCHPDDLWATYFTSSFPVKSLIEENGLEFFETKIVMVCETPEDALRVEGLLISKTHKFPGLFESISFVVKMGRLSIWAHTALLLKRYDRKFLRQTKVKRGQRRQEKELN
ncbi:hypothetical protein F371_gp066 [Escherichia phage PhaxI]|uniref:Uncharacterized protein n=1 Tax=Escherichia phage PhaxI TaxID=926589 RepID=G9IIK0_9CAUD|nr:hypothetical protein F371_gp066 [Escherichia phage PhaxI]AEW24338.1 hypothetical protein [Escherichia phage PhaxI]